MNKNFLLSILLLFISAPQVRGFDYYEPRKKYHFGVTVSNPLGLITKGGGGLEVRTGQVAYMFSYTKYWGAYAGRALTYETIRYIRTRKRDEYYLYAKIGMGIGTFDSKKLKVYGDVSDIVIPNVAYSGAGAGFGKRYNRGIFFIRWNFGFKYYPIDFLPDKEKKMFRLFYATGPGSILEYNVRMGIQF